MANRLLTFQQPAVASSSEARVCNAVHMRMRFITLTLRSPRSILPI